MTGTSAAGAVPVGDTGLVGGGVDPDQIPPEERARLPKQPDGRFRATLIAIRDGSALTTVLAVVIALVVGAVLIAATNPTVQSTAGYFFARPTDMLAAIWACVSGSYAALFQGGVYDFSQTNPLVALQSLGHSIGFATPLIAAGLGIAVAFRSGVFNIGGQGQVLMGAAFAGYVGFTWDGPPVITLLVAVLFGLLGGGLLAGLVGVLKARTGANEVIVTIMLNYVVYYLLDFALQTPLLQDPKSVNPISPPTNASAVFFPVLPPDYHVNVGFLLAIAATFACSWLLSRSSIGFKMRAVGENPRAARVAGIEVDRVLTAAMVISGVLVGFAGVYQVLGTTTTGFTSGVDAGIGFNAITVALLGRSRPWGVFWAGILFGVFQAGGYTMQAAQNVDINAVQVVQSVIVLFIAAPPLVRTIFRLPQPKAVTA
ncbi:ABC transporter permease [uncultured Amnibacterium sp.]|uniref:ABC transporter permease n=1 Tax=uncultured Amnibacterium sp. TaxID=1631851 RepID=UPI0035C9F232